MEKQIASLLRAPFLLLLAALACPAAEMGTLWQIGANDRNTAEFVLAPKAYERYTQDGLFMVGLSETKTAWPYVHPGPADVWAGSRPHTFSILFGVEKRVTQGNCRLLLDMVDTHSKAPPTLRFEVNGQAFDRTLPAGASDDSVSGNPAAGKPYRLVLDFPAALLRAGNNQINITSTAGSWFLYDSLALEAPDTVVASPVREMTVLTLAQLVPGVVQREGKPFQRIAATITP